MTLDSNVCPQTRLAEIAADNEKYVEMKAAYDLERQMRYMQVMYKGQVTTVAINENTAAKELLTQAKSQLVTALSAVNPAEVVDGQTVEVRTWCSTRLLLVSLASFAPQFLTAQLLETPLDRCRLRLFNTIKSLFLDPVAYSHTETTLKALQLTVRVLGRLSPLFTLILPCAVEPDPRP